MSAKVVDLKLLDNSPLSRELDLVSAIFHRINRALPENRVSPTVAPTCSARDAVDLMLKSGYSQLPIVSDGKVWGVFSYRSFARRATRQSMDQLRQYKVAPGELEVTEYQETWSFAQVTDEMKRVLQPLDADGGVLVGSESDLLGVLTPMDFLHYLYQAARPFVMLSEIELGLRELLRRAMTPEQLVEAAARCLARKSRNDQDSRNEQDVPKRLEDMTFGDYQGLISNGENWRLLEAYFGRRQGITNGRLEEIRELRNAVFHFRREITDEDRTSLEDHRHWVMMKLRQAESAENKGSQA